MLQDPVAQIEKPGLEDLVYETAGVSTLVGRISRLMRIVEGWSVFPILKDARQPPLLLRAFSSAWQDSEPISSNRTATMKEFI